MSATNPVTVPMLDLKAQFAQIKDEIMRPVGEIFEKQAFILGPAVADMEEELARYLGVGHTVGVASGTDALLLSLMALGIGPGDEVITTPFTFFATAGSIMRTGAKPVFVDIDPDTYNIDPKALEALLEGENKPAKAKAIIPVHLFGQPADMDEIMELAGKHGLYVVEDAAQAISCAYPSRIAGKDIMIGGIGTTGCFSFFPSKNLGGAGDGGLISTNNDELAAKLRSMRTHGSHPQEKYRHLYLGGNFRLDALQAVVVSAKLPHLDSWSQGRRENAEHYNRLFKDSGLLDKELVSTPFRKWPECERSHIYNQYVIRAKDRDGVMAALKQAKVGCAIYYPIPMHLLECFASLGGKKGDLPQAEKAAAEVLAIPVYPELTTEQKERVVEVISEFYA
ncbi:DegT/DnrJ/EryC1/StrS family aminotransferase [Dethiosulfatarculus sandiegensis]|uniref:Pleiotropic regulatory protein n=1 Tax=Dethiosulfatarculus sandiegensis TaxID=1429043 RepID=A0A0D2K035_9BACT|nr:DegT/DnrJ/EryC1/StrS family aminotransferase [Dethiosulfatarculus sandiegensis]KIX15100.1 Pleiotropic regulatory protein [Dethiosulfatarculus sandiegensis]